MKRLITSLATLVAVTTGAVAQPRPSTLQMSCRQAAGLVAARGAIVLSTGTYTYDRYVSDTRFCLRTEITFPEWVPTADTPQCFIGYRCKEADPFDR